MIIGKNYLISIFILSLTSVDASSLLSKGMSALKGMSGDKGSQNGKCRQIVIIGPPSKDDNKIANFSS